MTDKLFLDDSQARQMTATVLSVDAAAIVLDRTVFYARSGGQPGDRGVLRWAGGETAIAETIKGEGETVIHVPAAGANLPPVGAPVTGTLDWDNRHRLMRMHSTLHLLCAALPGISVTGGQIGAEKSRLDLDMAEPPAKDALEEKLNALIDGNHTITTEWVDESVLDTNPTLVRTLSVKPPRGAGRLRLVRIGAGDTPVDLQPCGGTHVATTSEIGRIRIAKIENKGRQNRRIVVELVA
jgi:misacylated tRNA(Ala) deacylase